MFISSPNNIRAIGKPGIFFIGSLVFLFMFTRIAAAQQKKVTVPQKHPIYGEEPQTVQDKYVPNPKNVKVTTWVDSLTIPWSLRFLPNGDALVAQRPGTIVRIPKGSSEQQPFLRISKVAAVGDAGLMGMALHPDFEDHPYIYVMYTYRNKKDTLVNRVARYKYNAKADTATFDRVIFDHIPAAPIHVGGRIAFGPDGMLYIGTGSRHNPPSAQDMNTLAGKILRITPEGKIPKDNPFGNSPIYSLGHRVVEGITWDPKTGEMFNADIGPNARDEINHVKKGSNDGWPVVVGAPGIPKFEDPIVMWKNATVPPAGMTFYHGDLYVATLKSQALIRIVFGNNYQVKKIERWFAFTPTRGLYGRLRDVRVGPDGNLYVCTTNTDGRAVLRPHDDKILKLTFNKHK
jgi:quinoprotein glucose dehydrogenase